MIVYDLICHRGHIFEVWFASAESFDQQKERNLLECPICGSIEISKRLIANIGASKTNEKDHEPPDDNANHDKDLYHVTMPSTAAEMIAHLRQVVNSTENVGEHFPEEARKMHYHETPLRPIRGQAAQHDIEALAEEGIDIDILPDFLLHNLN
jgi:Uncharacterized protein conserved in bacteria